MQAMQTMTIIEPRQTNSAAGSKSQSAISRLMEKLGQGGVEKGENTEETGGSHFLSMLKADLAALKNAKHHDVGKGEKSEQKQKTIAGAQAPTENIAEKIDERQEDGKEIPAAFLSIIHLAIDNLDKTEKGPVEGLLKETLPESGKDKAAALESLLTALREKGIGGKDISQILAAFKEGELKSAPSFHVALQEKGIGKKEIRQILATFKEEALKSVPLERQSGEAKVEKDSGAGMFKATLSESKNNNDKVAVPESFLVALQEKGIDTQDIPKIWAAIKEEALKSVLLEGQSGEAKVEKDPGAGMFKAILSASGNDNDKVAVSESFLVALQEKGIGEKEIPKILAAFKERELKSVPSIFVALQEKGIDRQDIPKIWAAIKEEALKSVPLERQSAEAKIEKDAGAGMFKAILSASENANNNDKVAVPESFLVALQEKGIDTQDIPKIWAAIKEEALKSVPLERQAGEAKVQKGSGAGMFKAAFSDSMNNSDKVSVPESFLVALQKKGIDTQDIPKIWAAIKEEALKSVPVERQSGEAKVEQDLGAGMFKAILTDSRNDKAAVSESILAALLEKGIDEKDIGKVLAAFKEGELKAVQLERQTGEAAVAKDLAAGMFKVMSADSSTKKGDGSGDSPAFSGKGKAAVVPESFTLAGQADLTVYGSDSRVIKPGDAKPVEARLLVDQIVSQLPTETDKGFSRVKIALFPENLGGLDMDITIRNNKVHVVLMADRQDVRQALQGHSDQLKSALQNQGLLVDSMDFLLRDSPRGMDSGSGGSHLSWRENNSGAKGEERERGALSASVAMLSAAARQTGGTLEGGISLFV